MKVLVIAVLALLATVHATPYILGRDYGRGMYGGRGGGGYGSGGEHDHSGYNRGDHGYLDEGYGSHGLEEDHNIRHQENEYDKSVHQHQVSDVNSGGVSSGGRGGSLHTGQGSFGSGVNDYGRNYGNGYNYGMM